MIWLFIYLLLVVAIAILVIRYFDGEFTYRDEVIEKMELANKDGGTTNVYMVKRTYNSNRVKIFKHDIKLS